MENVKGTGKMKLNYLARSGSSFPTEDLFVSGLGVVGKDALILLLIGLQKVVQI